MRKREQVSEFETYLTERNGRIKAALSAIEKAGRGAALDRCRALARRIQGDLHHKKPEHFVNVMSLADFQVSLERAASVRTRAPAQALRGKSERARYVAVPQVMTAKCDCRWPSSGGIRCAVGRLA